MLKVVISNFSFNVTLKNELAYEIVKRRQNSK